MKQTTRQQLLLIHKKWQQLLIISTLLWLLLMLLLYIQPFVPVGDITRDPATIAEHPPYYGALSNLGILLWSASAAVCFLSATLLKVIQYKSNTSAFFITFTGLSTVLCLDDTYLLHENVFVYNLPIISIPDHITILFYAVIVLFAVSRFWTVFKKTQLWLFGLSLLLFLVAAGSDYVLPEGPNSANITFLIEDGTKLFGIFLWLTYFFRTSVDLIAPAITPKMLWSTAAKATTYSPPPSVVEMK